MEIDLPKKKVFIGPAILWKRIAAFFVDMLLLDFFIISLFSSPLGTLIGAEKVSAAYAMLEADPGLMQVVSMIFLLIMMLIIAYFVLVQYATGQTLGCLLFRIRVVADNKSGNTKSRKKNNPESQFIRPRLWQCLVRNLFLIPIMPFILLWVADPIYMLFAKKGQRLTEFLSMTRVIERFEI